MSSRFLIANYIVSREITLENSSRLSNLITFSIIWVNHMLKSSNLCPTSVEMMYSATRHFLLRLSWISVVLINLTAQWLTGGWMALARFEAPRLMWAVSLKANEGNKHIFRVERSEGSIAKWEAGSRIGVTERQTEAKWTNTWGISEWEQYPLITSSSRDKRRFSFSLLLF